METILILLWFTFILLLCTYYYWKWVRYWDKQARDDYQIKLSENDIYYSNKLMKANKIINNLWKEINQQEAQIEELTRLKDKYYRNLHPKK